MRALLTRFPRQRPQILACLADEHGTFLVTEDGDYIIIE